MSGVLTRPSPATSKANNHVEHSDPALPFCINTSAGCAERGCKHGSGRTNATAKHRFCSGGRSRLVRTRLLRKHVPRDTAPGQSREAGDAVHKCVRSSTGLLAVPSGFADGTAPRATRHPRLPSAEFVKRPASRQGNPAGSSISKWLPDGDGRQVASDRLPTSRCRV